MSRYRAEEHQPYFCTLRVLNWIPVFIDSRHIEPIIESLQFCQRYKGLQVFAFAVMPNHMHAILGCDGDLHAAMRDFKRFTSRSVHERLKSDGRKTILEWLAAATEPARRERGELAFWEDGFHPQEISSERVWTQKVRYVHENPVRKGLVASPQDWWFSSARNEAGFADVCLEVDALEF